MVCFYIFIPHPPIPEATDAISTFSEFPEKNSNSFNLNLYIFQGVTPGRSTPVAYPIAIFCLHTNGGFVSGRKILFIVRISFQAAFS